MEQATTVARERLKGLEPEPRLLLIAHPHRLRVHRKPQRRIRVLEFGHDPDADLS